MAALAGCRQTWSSELVSVNADGTNGGNDWSDYPVISPDGTKVAFMTVASDLGPVDTNPYPDIYVRDLVSGTTTLVSVNAAGTDSGNRGSSLPKFSSDGTKVLFTSSASDLGPTDTNGTEQDVYVRDLVTGTTSLVSADAAGVSRGGDAPTFSPDGTKVAYMGPRETATGPATSGSTILVTDLTTGTTTDVVPEAPTTSPTVSKFPVFSPDGTKIAFVSTSGALGPHDSSKGGLLDDVYVRDLVHGTTTLVSANASNTDSGNRYSGDPVYSPDSSRVVFTSLATDLGPLDTNGAPDLYVRDLSTNTTQLVSADATGSAAGFSDHPVFSPDGTSVAFVSGRAGFGPHDTNGKPDVYLRHLLTGTTTLVSVNADSDDSGNDASAAPAFTPDSSTVVFLSRATDLGPTDAIRSLDVYARDLRGGITHMISMNASRDGGGNLNTTQFAISASGPIVFTSGASNLGHPDTNDAVDIYVATRIATP
jgi:Tol biopolymer transport system component